MPNKIALLVDDREDLRQQLRKRLEVEGWLVHEANSFSTGLQAWENLAQKPTVVIVDLHMEFLNAGIELGKRIAEKALNSSIIIQGSCFPDIGSYPENFYYLVKPLDLNALKRLLRGILQNGSKTEDLEPAKFPGQ